MTARLSVTYGDTTELHNMDVLAGDIYQAQLVFTVGQTYDLTIQCDGRRRCRCQRKTGHRGLYRHPDRAGAGLG